MLVARAIFSEGVFGAAEEAYPQEEESRAKADSTISRGNICLSMPPYHEMIVSWSLSLRGARYCRCPYQSEPLTSTRSLENKTVELTRPDLESLACFTTLRTHSLTWRTGGQPCLDAREAESELTQSGVAAIDAFRVEQKVVPSRAVNGLLFQGNPKVHVLTVGI